MLYVAYGLRISSALPLPELVFAEDVEDAPIDVTIQLGSVDQRPSGPSERSCLSATADETYLFWEHAGAFLVRGGREIIVDPIPGVEERVLRICILGPALGVLLHQRGYFVLHASAVAIAGESVAFLGEKGWGKSTIAAALHRRGHGVVADDVTAIQVARDCPLVYPGFPQLKLWPETVASLGDNPETLPRLDPHLEKRARRVVQGFPSTPRPLRRIYVLAEGTTQEIEPLQPQEALIELIRHSYGPRFLQPIGASHFRLGASVVKNVTVCNLKRPRSLPALSSLARLVEEDLAQNTEQILGA